MIDQVSPEGVRDLTLDEVAVEYRELRSTDDLEAITRLLHRAYGPLAEAGMRFVASHQDVATTRRRIENGETFVATLQDRIVGVITVRRPGIITGTPHYSRNDVGCFGQFAVDPEYQRHGIGSKLMQLVEERARDHGASELALDTSEQAHQLIAFYEKRGYRFIEFVRWDAVNYRSVVLSKVLA